MGNKTVSRDCGWADTITGFILFKWSKITCIELGSSIHSMLQINWIKSVSQKIKHHSVRDAPSVSCDSSITTDTWEILQERSLGSPVMPFRIKVKIVSNKVITFWWAFQTFKMLTVKKHLRNLHFRIAGESDESRDNSLSNQSLIHPLHQKLIGRNKG